MIDLKQRIALAEQANGVFDRIRRSCDEKVKGGAKTLDVVAILKEAGIQVDEHILGQLQIPTQFIPHPFLSWDNYFPWKPLWSYYWSIHAPGTLAALVYLPATAGVPGAGGLVSVPPGPLP